MAQTAEKGAPTEAGKADDSPTRLFAASARNLLPRVFNNLATAAVTAFVVGPLWAVAYFVAVWIPTFAAIWMMRLIQREKRPARAALLTDLQLGVNVVSGAFPAGMAYILWTRGDDLAKLYAVASLFIGAAYVLLHYYADKRAFRWLVLPHALAAAAIGLATAGFDTSGKALVILLAVLVATVNFFHLSRRMLDSSRTALRQARARAIEGELAAEAANAAKSTFLAIMSHEIRTPLNGVLGMAQAMAADELSDLQRDRLTVIHQSGEALLAVLNDILDLSKIEAGKLEIEEIEFDLGEVARGAHSAFTALANKKGLSFCLDVERARGVYLGDPTRLRQILYNLISNALKFTERGEIRVTATRREGALELIVADTGVGIPPEALSRLFDKFAQVDASTTRRFGGTGLGLAICQQLAQLMGGAITVDSEVGRGSRFIVSLPLPRVGEERQRSPLPAPDTAPGAAPAESALSLRVLAAEDNSVNQLVLKTLLHQIGVEPVVVEDGQAAVEAWERGDWDAILMDIQMPLMDGPTAARRIREREAATGRRRTPILALTANAMSHQVSEYLAAGMDGHIAKPIDAARLFQALQTAIEPPEADGLAAAAG
ncbi:ATP-binding protein [Phenylobacterium terrae]|uniref:histidine kinase n=1 Tax=Phenylobacterium terrae TaxID=2665495 RepID=A0ABW4N5Q9_9CAUL